MRIMLLHLSDLHIKDRNSANIFQIGKIADALVSVGACNKIFIILSGDIAFSGEEYQYKTAGYILGTLIKSTIKKLNYKDYIEVLCIPGNHDVKHGDLCRSNAELQKIFKENSYEAHLPIELEKQKDFFNFASFNKCFTDRNAYCRRLIECLGYKFEFNLLNSGIFSIKEEDKGLHYIPQHFINTINTPTGADFVISIMHHAPDWYNDSQKNQIERVLLSKSSLLFLGHEHYLGTKTILYNKEEAVVVHAGGALCNGDDWTKSEFDASILDTESMEYILWKYKWNANENQYESTKHPAIILPRKLSEEKHLRIKENYGKLLCEDMKHDVSNDFRDYFVFPRIQAEANNGMPAKEFTTEDTFIDEIMDKKKVLITGGYNIGKTALLRSLFLKLSKKKTVVFCDIGSISGKNTDRIIKNNFEDIYGDIPSDYIRFDQMPKENKVLIIDDIDQIKSSDFEKYITSLNEKFEYFIFASKSVLDIDMLERMKGALKVNNHIYKYTIMPFFADKRKELIEKIVSLKVDDKTTVPKTTKILCEAIKTQKRFISLDPDFIINFVDYYCKNIGEVSNNDSGVFGKVFEASLTTAISPYQTSKLSVDKIFIILSKIAHYIHFNKVYPIHISRINTIIDKYNNEYGDSVNPVNVVEIVAKSRIIVCVDDNTYRFVNKSTLAFFVAREINNQYNDTGDDSNLQYILKYSCFGINQDILLFISYITDNVRILRLIINMTEEFTAKWTEFDLKDNVPSFLKSEKHHDVELPQNNAKEIEEKSEVNNEESLNVQMETVDIYDYSEDDVEKFLNQIIRACSLLIVVSKCLPNFEHNMRKADKDAFVEAIYKLPNKIFNLWATEVDKDKDELILYFKEQSQDYYNRQKKVTDDDILRALQWAAMSFLLDLYNIAVSYSTKDNSSIYLNKYDYKCLKTYSLEHLMMLEKQSACEAFIIESQELVDDVKNPIVLTMTRRIVGHALVFLDDLKYDRRQKLTATFFPTKTDQKKLLLQRIKNSEKKE